MPTRASISIGNLSSRSTKRTSIEGLLNLYLLHCWNSLRTRQNQISPKGTMPVSTNWYENFFHGMALDLWRQAIPPQQTKAEGDFLIKALACERGALL